MAFVHSQHMSSYGIPCTCIYAYAVAAVAPKTQTTRVQIRSVVSGDINDLSFSRHRSVQSLTTQSRQTQISAVAHDKDQFISLEKHQTRDTDQFRHGLEQSLAPWFSLTRTEDKDNANEQRQLRLLPLQHLLSCMHSAQLLSAYQSAYYTACLRMPIYTIYLYDSLGICVDNILQALVCRLHSLLLACIQYSTKPDSCMHSAEKHQNRVRPTYAYIYSIPINIVYTYLL